MLISSAGQPDVVAGELPRLDVRPRAWWRHPGFAVGIPLLLGLIHVALVAPHYFVGSFDDDSGYILAAQALLHGHGLTWTMPNGLTVAGSFPPGYSALLVPLLWIWPHTFDPLRWLSVVSYAAIFPLTWVYLGRRRIGDGVRVATLLVLALGPPLATYGSMVMAETPFLALLLVLLLLVDRWDNQDRVFTRAGVGVILASAGLVWCKEAGIGITAGLCLWLLLPWCRCRSWRKAVAVGAGAALLLLPVVVARVVGGVPLAGSRYSQELGSYYHGGLINRLIHVAPHGLWQMLSTALPATVVPYLSPLPIHGSDVDVWKLLSWQVSVVVAVGAVVWARRYRDAAIVMVPAYLAETLLWPEVNERRVILVLPVLVAWYVLGAKAAWDAAWSWTQRRVVPALRRRGWGWAPAKATLGAVAALIAAVVTVAPLTVQLPRDYLVSLGQDTSHFGGSPYVQLLAQLGQPGDVVETDYVSSTALFTGHATHGFAFTETLNSCDPAVVRGALALDDAGFLLLGDLNKPGVLDSPCLRSVASSSPWAVRLLQTNRDNASVFELIGPGTGHPDLQDLTASATQSNSVTAGGTTVWEWDWGFPRPLTQVSVGQAGRPGADRVVALQIREGGGGWHTIATASSAVGDGPGSVPYLLATLPAATTASALRLLVTPSAPPTTGSAPPTMPPPVDVHALGPGGAA